MLRLTPFRYLQPRTLAEAVALAREHLDDGAVMGGGTDLLPNIKHRLAHPKHVIGLRSVAEMSGIDHGESGGLRIGGAVTLSQLVRSPAVREEYPALCEAASLISTPQVRRMGTIGGNICLDVRCNYYNQSEHWRQAVGYCMKKDSEICRVAPGSDRCWAVSSADTVPVLVAFDAEIKVASVNGQRWEPLSDVYRDDGLAPTTLGPGDIVAGVRIPSANGLQVRYSKLRVRMSFDFPLVGVATGISFGPDGTVERARIVMTAVGSHPIQVREAEELLTGHPLTEDTIRGAGETVFRAAHPMDNTEGSIPHRKRMARVYVERSLRELGKANRR